MADPKSPEENRDRTLSISSVQKVVGILTLLYSISQLLSHVLKVANRKQFQELIIEKAKKGTIVRIIVAWQPSLALRILPGADERGLDGRA